MLKNYTKMQLSQLEELNKQIEVRKSRRENIALRNQWMKAKTVKNYQTEYDRIRNHLANTTTPGLTREHAQKRVKVLEGLGARAFDIIG
jgi:hypothetical protein